MEEWKSRLIIIPVLVSVLKLNSKPGLAISTFHVFREN